MVVVVMLVEPNDAVARLAFVAIEFEWVALIVIDSWVVGSLHKISPSYSQPQLASLPPWQSTELSTLVQNISPRNCVRHRPEPSLHGDMHIASIVVVVAEVVFVVLSVVLREVVVVAGRGLYGSGHNP